MGHKQLNLFYVSLIHYGHIQLKSTIKVKRYNIASVGSSSPLMHAYTACGKYMDFYYGANELWI